MLIYGKLSMRKQNEFELSKSWKKLMILLIIKLINDFFFKIWIKTAFILTMNLNIS